jgi:TRAP-type transport system large permease protein
VDITGISLLLLGSLCLFLIFGFPVGIAILLSSVITLVVQNIPLKMAMMKMLAGVDNYLLTAIPFFVLAGILMRMGGITQRIISFAILFFGPVRGGLGHVNICASMIFAGISGSSVADTASIGSILIPEMVKKNYPVAVSAAITCASSTIGIIIPPSIPIILYSMASEASVGKLFLGGAIPGLLVGFLMMAITAFIAHKEGYGKERERRASMGEIIIGLKDSSMAILMPVIIIGGIVGGVVTPTEAAVVAVAYAFIIGKFLYKKLNIAEIPSALIETVRSTAVVMLIVAAATLFGWILAYVQIPQKISITLLSLSTDPLVILIIINIILLIAGTFSDIAPNILILTPIFLPVVTKLGIDPVHFGIIVVTNQAIALVTPPVGNCLYIAANISKIGVERIFLSSLPYLLSNFLVLALVTFFPNFVMFLPNLLM